LHLHNAIGLLTGRIRVHPTGGDLLLMDIRACAVGKDHLHAPPPVCVAGGIPIYRESTLRALLPLGSWRQSMVPSGIRVQLLYRRAAPGKTRPRCQPICLHSTLLPVSRVGLAHFHGPWCPGGHDNCYENEDCVWASSGHSPIFMEGAK